MATESNQVLKGTKLIALTLLRVAIGWHFLFEGLSKLFTPAWSSADYLLLSNWIFAGFFHWIANSTGLLIIADFIVTWGLILIGLSLFAGLFDRIAAIAGMILLTMFWMANPPLTGLDFGIPHEGNYLLVDKNMVEFFGLLILSLIPTGKYLGLAHFCRKNRKPDDSRSVAHDTNQSSKHDLPVENKSLDRRTLIRGLSTLPFLGIFGYALFKQKQWESYE